MRPALLRPQTSQLALTGLAALTTLVTWYVVTASRPLMFVGVRNGGWVFEAAAIPLFLTYPGALALGMSVAWRTQRVAVALAAVAVVPVVGNVLFLAVSAVVDNTR